MATAKPKSSSQQLEKEKLLFDAVKRRDSRQVKNLVKHCNGTHRNEYGCTLLHFYSTEEITKILLEKTEVDVNSRNREGRTPLHTWPPCVSYENGNLTLKMIDSENFESHYNILKCLLEAGGDCNLKDGRGRTVLNDVLIRWLSPKLNLREEQWLALVQLLLFFNADPNIKDKVGRTPLHEAIGLKSARLVRLMIKNRADVNRQDIDGRTVLHLLAHSEFDVDYLFEALTLLTANGADPTIQDKDGWTALHLAVMSNNEKVAELLLQAELSNKCGKLTLDETKESNSILDIADKNGLTALHHAVAFNQTRMANLLIHHGGNVNAVDKYGATCLHYAAYGGKYEMIKYLRDVGGNPELADKDGNTPEIFALRRNHLNTVAALKKGTEHSPNNTAPQQKYSCDEILEFPIFDLTPNQSNHIQVDDWDKLFEEKYDGDSQKFLKDLMDVQGVGKIPNVSEVKEIQQAIEMFMKELTKCMSDMDGRFKGEMLKSGSVYEGTKVGDPDEFDYMFILTEFEKICSINVTDQTYDDVCITRRNNKPIGEFDEFFEYNNLKCSRVMEKFVEICMGALFMMDYKSLPNNLYVHVPTDKTMKGPLVVNPGITTCEIGFIWCGAFYKHLVITADLVPAMRVKSWPKFAETVSELLTKDIIKQGCHVVQKSDKWRFSFSLAEQTIMNRLSDNLRAAYIEAKVARDPKVTLECVIFGEVIEDWSGKPKIDGRKLIPSYLLKLVLFDCIEECQKNGRDTSRITSATIFSKLHKCIQENKPVPFFFMKKHNFLDKAINDERPYKHVAFAVSVIDNFFNHKKDIHPEMVERSQAESFQDQSLKAAEAMSRGRRTLIQDQPSKAKVPRLVTDLHHDVLEDLLVLLNQESYIASNWRKFAKELGFSMLEILVLGEESNPASAAFRKWMSQDGEKTVSFLIAVLRMKCFDAVKYLEKHEFTDQPRFSCD